MHSTRWITGLIAAPLLIFIILAGGLIFTFFVALAAVVAVWEYNRIFFSISTDTEIASQSKRTYFIEYGFTALIVLAAGTSAVHWVLFTVFAGLVALGVRALFQFKNDQQVALQVAGHLQGMVYIGIPLALIVLIRNGDMGNVWIFSLLIIIFAGDTAAYYSGSHFGKNKLCPWVSPNKTIEGALGGLAANIAVGIVLNLFFFNGVSWLPLLAMCVLMGAVGQVGDLFESVLKRRAGMKDSGNILPGHGGILDRIDALLFAAPVAWIFITKVL